MYDSGEPELQIYEKATADSPGRGQKTQRRILQSSNLGKMPEARGRCGIVLCFAHGWHTLEVEDAYTLEKADDHQLAYMQLQHWPSI